MAINTQTGVADPSQAVTDMTPARTLAHALLGGTTEMRRAGTTYLPKWPKEETEAYTTRLSVSVLFPAYKRTVQTLAGKPFSKPITVGDDVPERFKPWLSDIDLQGRNIDTFASDIMQLALGYGLAGILVDYPTVQPGTVRTQAQEQAAKLRPYWIEVKPQQILGWRAARVDGMWKLLQLRIAEVVEVPDGEFGVESVDQVRVLEPGKWTTYRANENGSYGVHETGLTTLSMIPFVPVYGGRTGFMTAVPPLLEVAHLNVAHWQSASDQQNILHVARVPILTVTGVDDPEWKMTVGASSAIKLPNPESKMAYVEHSGSAIGAGAEDLKVLEERMRQAGAELLVLSPGQITATQVNTENAVGMCVLQRITQGFEDALDMALQITAEWVGEESGGTVTVFNDYGAATLQEASAQLLLATNQAGKLSDKTLHSEYQRRGILSADMSWEDEQALLEIQGPALETMGGTPLPTDQQALGAQPGAPVVPEPQVPAFDMDALIAAIGSITFPAPIVNVAAQPAALPPQITVEAPTINVTVPEQQAPVVNFTAPAITVEAPTVNVNVPEQPAQPAPIVNIEPAVVNVSSPPVNVTIEKGGSVKFTENDDGDITGAVIQ